MVKRPELRKLAVPSLASIRLASIVLFCLISLVPVSVWAEDIARYPALTEKEVDLNNPKPTEQHEQTVTGSYVNHLTRSYSTENPGLSLKVPGGSFSLNSSYEEGSWGLGSARSGMNGLGFGQSGLGFHEFCAEFGTPIITSIIKDGKYNYNLPAENFRKVTEYDPDGNMLSESCEYVGDQVYIHEGEKRTYTIRKNDDGYRWEDKYGNWVQYGGKSEDASSGQLLSSGNRHGKTEQALYDAAHKIIGYADRDGNQVIWITYNPDGLISAVQDSTNRRIEYTYYSDGTLKTVKDVLDYETTYEYDAEGRIIKVIKPGGRESDIVYNDSGDVASVLNAEGEGYYFEFDYDKTKKEYYALVRFSSGRIKEVWYDEEGDTKRIDINGTTIQTIVKDGNALIITDERGLQTRKEYDEWDNLTKIIYPDNSVVSYAYEHTYNQRIREVNERGVVTEYEYDEAGNLIKQTEAVGTDVERVTECTYYPDGKLETIIQHIDENTIAVTRIEYDTFGNLTKIIDPENNVVQFTSHDFMGNVLTKLDVRNKEWTYGYDNMGRQISITDSLNNTIQRVYDAAGNLAKIIDPKNNETAYLYDHNGNVIQITNATGVTLFEYNTDGRLIRQTDPEGRQIRYEYDEYGRRVKIIDGNGNEIKIEYDDFSGFSSSCSSCSGGGANRPGKIIFPTFVKEFRYDQRGRKIEEIDIANGETSVIRFTYDASGNLISRTDKENHTTTYDYDALDRLVAIIDPVGQTAYTYNSLDNLVSLTDAEGHTTQFEYDKNGLLTKEIRPMNQETIYHYETGFPVEKYDARGQKTTYMYDDAGRLEQIAYYNGKTVAFTYDNIVNLKTYTDGVTSATYEYDALNRKISETVDYGNFSKTFTYDYYANGLKKTFTMPDSTVYGYTYDTNNRLTSVSIPGLGEITYPSYTWMRSGSVVYPGGSKREYEYDPLMRIKTILVKDPGGNPVLNYSYTYDKIGNILTRETAHGDYIYTYDDVYRLTQTDNPVQDDEAFTYDAVGNRLTSAAVAGNLTYNDNDELLTFADGEYDYDANGNMIQKRVGMTTFNYIYNAEDRLIKVEDDLTKTVIAEYYYDPFGRRLWKEVGGTRTYFLYADEGLVAEYDANGNALKSYGYKPNSIWTTDPLFMKQGGEYYFYQNDNLSTPQKLIGVNGAVVWVAQYSSFGKAEVQVETVINSLRFPGQYYDAETELFYNWHRYYDSKTGRYLRADPFHHQPFGDRHFLPFLVFYSLITPQELNDYTYAINNPVNFYDPNGLAIWLCYRRATVFPLGIHAYLWDDRPGIEPRRYRSCGRNAKWGIDPPSWIPAAGGNPTTSKDEPGPEGYPEHLCFSVKGSEGKEDEVMKCCKETGNDGWYFPYVLGDCHTVLEDCLSKYDLNKPGGAFGKFDPPFYDPFKDHDITRYFNNPHMGRRFEVTIYSNSR